MIQPDKLVSYKLLAVSSPAFRDGDKMPARFTCDGLNISPPLEIRQIPPETQSLALIMDDPDAPRGTWVHWVVWNIPVTHLLEENEIHGTEGLNDFQRHHYGGPCPPTGMHRYFFKVYALDTVLELPADTGKAKLEEAMSDHIIGFGEMLGLYKRNK